MSQHGSYVGWVNQADTHSLISDSSGDYLVMSVRSERCIELKLKGAQLLLRKNGKATRVWIDSG